MHGPINVKSPNKTSKWQMGFNSEFKGLMWALLLNLANSEIIRIKKKKFRWIRTFAALTSTFLAKKVARPIRNFLERTETRLSIWVDVQTQMNRPLTL